MTHSVNSGRSSGRSPDEALLRKADARTIEDAWRRIGALLDCFIPTECANHS
jgi:hypothetical protein